MNSTEPFKWRHFQKEIILLSVRWYLKYPLSYRTLVSRFNGSQTRNALTRNLKEIMKDRGLKVDHSTIGRWLLNYSPQIEERTRRHLKLTNDSWRVDETYIKVKGKWKYLYRAVDSQGNTLDFMLSAKRDKKAAKRFFIKILKAKQNRKPRVINVDKNPAYPPAIEELKQEGLLSNECELRQKKYLNNIIEQDHRFPRSRFEWEASYSKADLKKLAKYKSYFQHFHTAWRTLRGYEIMNAIRKGQITKINQGDILGQRNFIHALFGIAV